MNPTNVDPNARSGLRRSLLGYFGAWIVVLVAIVAAWGWIERQASEDIDASERASRTYTDEISGCDCCSLKSASRGANCCCAAGSRLAITTC